MQNDACCLYWSRVVIILKIGRVQEAMDEKDAGLDYSDDDDSVKYGQGKEEAKEHVPKTQPSALTGPKIVDPSGDIDEAEDYVIEDFSDGD